MTLIAGLTISIKNLAKTSFNPLCQSNNTLVFCANKVDTYAYSTTNSKTQNAIPSLIPTLINPVIIENKKEEIKLDKESKKEKSVADKNTDVVKTQEIVTKSNDAIFSQQPTSKKITNTTYPTSQKYWSIFEGFDFSGKMKQIYNSSNHEFVDNSIILHAKKELTNNPVYSTKIDDQRFYTKTAEYAGSKLMLKEKFQYGHIQFEAKIPNVSGILPAVWLLNQDSNNFTEVDLLEVPGSEKNTVYGVTHYGPNYASLSSDHQKMVVPNLSTQFHKYDMYKTAEKITVKIDGILLYEKNVSNAPKYNGINGLDQPLQLIINLNIGDAWAGPIDDSKLPVSMTIKNMMIEEYSN